MTHHSDAPTRAEIDEEAARIARAEQALAEFPRRWRAMVGRAKQYPVVIGPDGTEYRGLPSVWTAPLEMLVQEQEHLLREAGVDHVALDAPKSLRADAHEKALPEHVRAAYRRGVHLRGHAEQAVAARRAEHLERAAAAAEQGQ